MKERPILFSSPMVRAILDGRKTQTRRVVRKQFGAEAVPVEMCAETTEGWQTTGHSGRWWDDVGGLAEDAITCPFGVPGDRLWVRETFAHIYRGNAMPETRHDEDVVYAADGFSPDEYVYGSWKPSIHMPRWASRITLEVTGVRVERLLDISEQDAAAEGVESLRNEGECWKHYLESTADCDALICLSARESFRTLWESINGCEAWESNPWVWVVEFKRIGA